MMDELSARLLESVPDAMIVVDGDGKIVMVNGHAETMFGYDHAALIGQAIEILIPDASRTRHRAHIAGYFDNIQVRPMGQNLSLSGIARDGREFSVEISLGPIEIGTGTLVLAAVRDVTEQRRAEAETLAVKAKAAAIGEQLTNAIESIAEGLVLYDSKGRLVLCNSVFREFYGYSEADTEPGVATYESLGRIDEKRDIGGRKRGTFPQLIADFHRTGIELITETPGDRVIERRQKMTADGGIISVQTDITDRTQADGVLQQRIKFSNLLQRITIAANLATSVEGVLQFWLDEVCAVIGWPVGHVYLVADDESGDVISTRLWHLDIPVKQAWIKRISDDKPSTPGKGRIGRVLASGLPAWIVDVTKDPTFERMALAGDLGLREGFAVPVLTGPKVVAIIEFFSHEAAEPDGHMLEIVAQIATQIGRVIERRVAQDALRESGERLRFVMDNSPAAINLKDSEGRYLLVNSRFEEWYGLAFEDVIGKTVREVFPEIKMKPFSELEQGVRLLKTPDNREFEFLFADGKKHLVLGAKFIVNDRKGDPVGIGTIETDITEQRQLETELRQAQKMEAVGQLTGGIAHDFNNLLAVISGNLDLLDETLEGDEKRQELLRWAIKATDDAATLTHQLLAFSRQQPLNPSAVQINDLVNTLLIMLSRTLGEEIAIDTDLCEAIWLTTVDPAQFENAVLNLVLNARDAMPNGGVVTITSANVTVDANHAKADPDLTMGDYVKLSVCDTGRGLSSEMIDHAFEPFYTTKEIGQGSGSASAWSMDFPDSRGAMPKSTASKARAPESVSICPAPWVSRRRKLERMIRLCSGAKAR